MEEPNIRIIGAVPRHIKNRKEVERVFAPVYEEIRKLHEAAASRQKKS